MAKTLIFSSSFNGRMTSLAHLSRSGPSPPSFSYRPSKIRMSQRNPALTNIEADISSYLEKHILILSPKIVHEPMHHFAFTAPRTAAPALCIAACELVGGGRDQAMAAAAAIHLVHATAYTHENLPLTGRTKPMPPIQHKYEPNIELLIADAMVPFGFELLARSILEDPCKNNAVRILRAIVEITQAAGCEGIIGCQYRELDIDTRETDFELITRLCGQKEGELYACAAACGAIMGGASEEEIWRLRIYGFHAGTLQGLLHGAGRNINRIRDHKKLSCMSQRLRETAMEQLEFFEIKKTETIYSFLDP